jgi:hypothetical protein
VADKIDAKAIRKRLGGAWKMGELGEDGWVFDGPGPMRVIVTVDEGSEPGTDWIHASISHRDNRIMPSYNDLKRLHAAVFGNGHAYQIFVPTTEHINIKSNVLHLWGKANGMRVLPDFGRFGSI